MGELVRFRDVAARSFREMDPEAGYVFRVSRDSAGYPAVYHKIFYFKKVNQINSEPCFLKKDLWP